MAINTILLTWQDNSANEDGFNIYISTDGVVFNFLDSVTADITDYTALGIVSGQSYWFRVTAFNGIGESTPINAGPFGCVWPSPLSPIIQDSFTDIDGTLLSSHSPDIGFINSWIFLNGGTLFIDNNRAKTFSAGVIASYYNNTYIFQDGYCQVTSYPVGSPATLLYLIARCDGINNYYAALIMDTLVVMRKVVNGVVSNISPIINDISTFGDIYRLEFNGTNLKLIKNSNILIDIDDSTFSTGYVAFGTYTITGLSYETVDDFKAGILEIISSSIPLGSPSSGSGAGAINARNVVVYSNMRSYNDMD